MNTTTETTPRIFLTDYASYNNGTQFEFGHWVDLTDFSNEDELNDYIRDHFAECDEKSPLDEFGSIREEIMITDFEGFPREFYSESMSFEDLYLWINADEHAKRGAQFLFENGNYSKFSDCLEYGEDVCMYEYNRDSDIYDIFEMFYPEAEEQERANPYLTIDYDQFRRENFTEFEYEGETYLVDDNSIR